MNEIKTSRIETLETKIDNITDKKNNKTNNLKQKTHNISLEEKIDNYDGDPLTKEFEWDEPVGKEIW